MNASPPAGSSLRILVVDDLRIPNERLLALGEVTLARTEAQGIQELQTRRHEVVFFDHDLGGEETTRSLVTWLEEAAALGHPHPMTGALIHSSNPSGAAWLHQGLRRLVPSTLVPASQWFA